MTEPIAPPIEDSALDDVRRVREQFSRCADGDIRRHVAQTQEAFQKLQAELGLTTVSPPAPRPS